MSSGTARSVDSVLAAERERGQLRTDRHHRVNDTPSISLVRSSSNSSYAPSIISSAAPPTPTIPQQWAAGRESVGSGHSREGDPTDRRRWPRADPLSEPFDLPRPSEAIIEEMFSDMMRRREITSASSLVRSEQR